MSTDAILDRIVWCVERATGAVEFPGRLSTDYEWRIYTPDGYEVVASVSVRDDDGEIEIDLDDGRECSDEDEAINRICDSIEKALGEKQ